MGLNVFNINAVLKELNISTSGIIRDGWMEILCPLPSHGKKDEHYGNCSINVETGIIACFSCHGRSNIFKLYQKVNNCTYLQALEKICQNSITTPTITPESNITQTFSKPKTTYSFTHIDLQPRKYYYTRQRGFTNSFCKEFNIKECLSGLYNDYMIIPIIDASQNIFEFEARKLKEYEYLQKYYNTKEASYQILKKEMEKIIKCNHLRIKDGKLTNTLFKNEVNNDILKYLVQSKVMYPKKSKIHETLWNIDNLIFSKDVYLFEGLGSIPKVFEQITENVTASFGSQITKKQIEYLLKFNNKIIHVPDFDTAGYNSVKMLSSHLKDNYLIKAPLKEDTDKFFVSTLKKTRLITPSEYLSQYIHLNFTK